MERFKSLWADSRGKTIAVLLVLFAATLLNQFRIAFIWYVATSLFLVVLFNSFIFWVRAKTWSVSLSSIITGLLIGIAFDPLSGFLPTAIACLLASASKNLIGKDSHKHIFNPAAFGIVVSSFIFSRPVAWWGASWGMAPVIIIAVGMTPILAKLRRLWMPLTFLTVYSMSFFGGQALWPLRPDPFSSALRLTFDGTVSLFAFVMLPEPKTAPLQGKWQLGWGVFVGFFVFMQNLSGIAIADPLLLALLAANLFGFVTKK